MIRHLPKSLIDLSLSGVEKDMSFYKSFIGHKMSGLDILSVSKKENNDGAVYIFETECPKCHAHFHVQAIRIITNTFGHICGVSKVKKKRVYKNSSCLSRFSQWKKFTCNSHHTHNEVCEDMLLMLKESVGFFTREYGTESFMNLCLEAELSGNKDIISSIYALY